MMSVGATWLIKECRAGKIEARVWGRIVTIVDENSCAHIYDKPPPQNLWVDDSKN